MYITEKLYVAIAPLKELALAVDSPVAYWYICMQATCKSGTTSIPGILE
jgi:hypothetical protein